ncbi:hypothetical protein B0H67DRAFT_646044 [Lasiosphaeris hirsuta]|uniref:Uncharacterized protein n=1 Tax=Lasiosphaeris hirsuta TaxID=260670 RepID=A0AA40A771_9PEZI|nr:hypothetical protein B0H67DRAFT_646044 [Lasiosphaeris hirsuta]
MERYMLSPDLYPKRMVRLWLHKHQFHRFLIGFGSINHMILATFRMMIDLLILSESGRPQAQMTVRMWWYESVLWVVTSLLFRYLDRFFWFRRPGKAYQFSVHAIILLAPVPLLVMHIWTIVLAARYDREYAGRLPFEISLWSAVVALVTLLPIHGLYIRMARRFLLADSDAQYEPSRPIGYRDDPLPTSSPPQGHSYLHDALTASRTRQPGQPMSTQTAPESQTPATGSDTAANAAIPPESTATPVMASPADHCPATGYVDAIPYALRGYRAWLRYPLLYKLLAFYMAFLTWEMIAIIREKNMEP